MSYSPLSRWSGQASGAPPGASEPPPPGDAPEIASEEVERGEAEKNAISIHERLRLVLGPYNSIYTQKNYNSGRDVATETRAAARSVTVTLTGASGKHSCLHIPVAPAEP